MGPSRRVGDWIQTASGGKFYPLDPRPEEIYIDDVAHALSNICRFGGHCSSFYSVAQHSVLVSLLCSPETARWGLLHDGPEAYLGDLPRPLKKTSSWLGGELFQEAEHQIMTAFSLRFGLALEMPGEVKTVDEVLLVAEARDLMGDPTWARVYGMGEYSLPAVPRVMPWSPQGARAAFLRRFEALFPEGLTPYLATT